MVVVAVKRDLLGEQKREAAILELNEVHSSAEDGDLAHNARPFPEPHMPVAVPHRLAQLTAPARNPNDLRAHQTASQSTKGLAALV